MRCCVPFCKNTSDNASQGQWKAISFHGFPSEVHLRAAWLRALGKQDSHLPDSAVVCSQHFLDEDIYETESGVRQICTGAIPSTVQVCMICLDTDSKMFLMSKHKMEGAYEKLTGYPLCNQANLKQTVCIQCAQKLINFNRFRDKSLRASALMMDLVGKHELITRQHIKTINRIKHQLISNMVLTTLGPDHCDLHILEHPSEDKQTKLEEPIIVKIERNDESMSVDGDMEMKNKDDSNIYDFVQDPLKYESVSFQCPLCLEEFVHEHAYMQHMSMHLQDGDGDGECDTSQVCRPHTAVSSSSSHSSLITENKLADPSPSVHAATTLGIPRQDRSLMKTQKSVKSCVSRNVASKVISYQATSKCGVLTAEYIKPVTNEEEVTASKSVYICDFCQKMFEQRRLLVKHIQNHKLAYRFTCNICQYKSKVKSHLVVHMRTHTGERPYCCKLCKSKFIANSHLVRHMRNHVEKPYRCKLCRYRYKQNSDLMVHMRTHTGKKQYSCKLCQYKCSYNSALVLHMRTHTGEKPYSCKLCKYKCSRNSHLAVHMRTHTGEKLYKCHLCKYKGARNCDLVEHMKTHTGEKPYSCKLCKCKFVRNSQLVVHMRTHTGEKPYKCDLCKYKATRKSALVQHMRTHTGEKPYSCKLCKYKCSQNSYLALHMSTHTGEKPYKCDLCKYKGKRKSALVQHMRTHTGEKPYSCKLCKFKSTRNNHLVQHMRTHL